MVRAEKEANHPSQDPNRRSRDPNQPSQGANHLKASQVARALPIIAEKEASQVNQVGRDRLMTVAKALPTTAERVATIVAREASRVNQVAKDHPTIVERVRVLPMTVERVVIAAREASQANQAAKDHPTMVAMAKAAKAVIMAMTTMALMTCHQLRHLGKLARYLIQLQHSMRFSQHSSTTVFAEKVVNPAMAKEASVKGLHS